MCGQLSRHGWSACGLVATVAGRARSGGGRAACERGILVQEAAPTACWSVLGFHHGVAGARPLTEEQRKRSSQKPWVSKLLRRFSGGKGQFMVWAFPLGTRLPGPLPAVGAPGGVQSPVPRVLCPHLSLPAPASLLPGAHVVSTTWSACVPGPRRCAWTQGPAQSSGPSGRPRPFLPGRRSAVRPTEDPGWAQRHGACPARICLPGGVLAVVTKMPSHSLF